MTSPADRIFIFRPAALDHCTKKVREMSDVPVQKIDLILTCSSSSGRVQVEYTIV